MEPCRVHITGASGAGTTTLGRALAAAWAVPSADTDDFYWEPTDPPYTVKRPVAERLALMERVFLPRRSWVLSGSVAGWGDTLIPRFDLVVFLTVDPEVRMARLRARERLRYGSEALAPGGAEHAGYAAFMDWAARYDDPGFAGRSRRRHETWVGGLRCRVLKLDSAAPVEELVARVMEPETAGVS